MKKKDGLLRPPAATKTDIKKLLKTQIIISAQLQVLLYK
jgi:hypothetical protein